MNVHSRISDRKVFFKFKFKKKVAETSDVLASEKGV